MATQGRRIWPDAAGWLPVAELHEPATYGRATNPQAKGRAGWWNVTCPDGRGGTLNPDVHAITEHEDGTISVHPSIDLSQRIPSGWHGWLERGVFRSC